MPSPRYFQIKGIEFVKEKKEFSIIFFMKQFPLKMKCRKPKVLTASQVNSWYSHLFLGPA